MAGTSPRRTLTDVLRPDSSGSRPCVPIIGAGLNLQAAQIAGTQEDDWAGLLGRIARELDVPARKLKVLPRPHLFRWESMLRLWSRVKRVEPFQAEVQLQQLTCQYLRSLEASSSDRELYREFASARFADVLSLNFDRRVALSVESPRFKSAPSPCSEGSHGETLYRHDLLQRGSGLSTRIWYPHGDTKKYSTLKLGVRKYGFYVGTIEEIHSGDGESWRVKRPWYQWDKVPGFDPSVPRWTDAFRTRPLVFIGVGLSFDEWPLWSMLARRAALPRRQRTPAYYVTGSAVAPEHAGALANHGVQVLSFPSFVEMWDGIRSAIA